MRGEIFMVLLAMWPCLQALFTVESEKESYNGELHEKVTMGCRFSHIQNVSQISVIWKRVKPLPQVDIYRLDKGKEDHHFTNKRFQQRVQLLREELENFQAVIELSDLRLNDSGIYRCIVIHDEADYKQIKLTIQAPYKVIKKTIRKLSKTEVELSCESQGLPLAHVTWRDSEHRDRTGVSETSYTNNSDGVFAITSKLSVPFDVNNYTCRYMTDDGTSNQTTTFNIPDEIPEESKWTTGYAAVGVIILLCVSLVCAWLIMCRRKKGKTSTELATVECESSGQNTVTSTDQLLTTFKGNTFA